MEQELAGVFGEWQIAELIEYDELGVTHPSFGERPRFIRDGTFLEDDWREIARPQPARLYLPDRVRARSRQVHPRAGGGTRIQS